MVKVIYLLGAGNSGSTIFSMALAGHSQVTSVGELSQIDRWYWEDELCSCGERMSQCAFWSDILTSELGAGFTATERKQRGILSEKRSGLFYRELSKKTGSPVIVDSSKDPIRLIKMAKSPEADIQIVPILLFRKGQSYIASMQRRSGIRQRHKMIPFALYRWAIHNLKNRIALPLAGFQKSVRTVDFESFSQNPEEELKRVCEVVGLGYESTMLDFWKVPHHNIAGTPSRFQPKPIRPVGRQALPTGTKVLFALLGGRQLNRLFGVKTSKGHRE